MSRHLFSKAIAEFLGAFAIVLFGCGSVAVSVDMNNPQLLQLVPFVFGFTVCIMIYATGHISGAHFNPAVTFAFASTKRFPWSEVPVYWFAQVLGSIFGCSLLWIMIPEISTYASTQPSVPVFNTFVAELVFSFFLMFVIKSVATDSRAEGVMAGAAIGITVTVAAFFGGPISGASLNPARSLGPAIFEANFDHLWIYLLAPVVGATLGAQLYSFIRCEVDIDPSVQKQEVKGCC
ncbi:MAG: MIP family channel protein [Pseudomonadota bacterium]